MNKRDLCDAAVRNDTATLSQLLQQDATLLDSANLNCEDKNALHIAAMLGHEAFVRAILEINSSSSYRMCLARDRDGRNPVHLAAMNGNLNILKLLIQHRDRRLIEAALEKADGGGTILHLCVKHNQLEALKLLLATFTVPKFVCGKNEDGMTALHLAIYYYRNQRARGEMIKLLINNGTSAEMVNVKDGEGKTALDLLLEQGGISPLAFFEIQGDRRRLSRLVKASRVDQEILGSLSRAKALIGVEVGSYQEISDSGRDWLRTRNEAVIVVAALIATMAFQATVSPPGGVWQDNLLEGPNPHRAGEAILAQTHQKYYRHLIRANTVAFVSSLSTITLLIRGIAIPRLGWHFFLLKAMMWVSIAAIAITYAISFVTVTPSSETGPLNPKTQIVIIVIMVFLLNLLRTALFLGEARFCRARPSFAFHSNIC